MKAALQSAPEPTEELLGELYDICRTRNKTPSDMFGTFIPILKGAWEAFAANHPYSPETGKGKNTLSPTNDLINATFYVVRRDNGTSHTMYPVKDAGLKLLDEPVVFDTMSNSSISDLGFMLNKTRMAVGETPIFFEPKQVKEALNAYFMTDDTVNPTPRLYAQPRDPEYCLARRTVEPNPECPYPDWQRFLSGFEDPEAYAAKIWAIVSGQDTSRQALVARSLGKTGKSAATNAIVSLFGNNKVAAAITGTHVSQSSRFLASNYRHAAFIYAPDCNVKTFLLSEVVKQLTGSDTVQYEIKGGAYGEYKAQAKLMVNMNPRPLILSDTHSRSRILYIEQHPIDYVDIGNAAFTELLTKQLPGFLAFGEKAFAERWRDNHIVLNTKAQKTFDALVGTERQDFYDFVFSRFEFGPAKHLDGADFTKLINKQKLNDHQRAEWREWLAELDGVEKETVNSKGKVIFHGIGRLSGVAAGNSGGMDDA